MGPCRHSPELIEQSFAQCLTLDENVQELRSVGPRHLELQLRQIVGQKALQRLYFVVAQRHVHNTLHGMAYVEARVVPWVTPVSGKTGRRFVSEPASANRLASHGWSAWN